MAKNQRKEVKPVVQVQQNLSLSRFSLLNFRVQSALLILIGFIFYYNTFSHEAAFDDRMAITDNEYVQQGVAGIGSILTTDAYQSYLEHRNGSNQLAGGRYRPLSLITFAIEQQIMGVPPEGETSDEKEIRIAQEMGIRHIINVWLYILCAVTLLYFLRTIIFPEHPFTAFITAIIFTILPVHTEVVANVKSRDEILSLLFISLAFIKAFRYRATRKTTDLVLALVCFFCALLSKEYAVTLVVLLPISFYLFGNESAGKSIRSTLPYFIPLALYFMFRLSSITSAGEGAESNVMNNPYLYANGLQKIATELWVLLDYFRLLIFPKVLASDYSYSQIPYTDFANPLVWLSIAIYLGLITAMFILLRRRHVLGFAIVVYLANLALVSNILFSIGAPMGERLIFHSSVGFAIAVAYLLCNGLEQLRSPAISKAGLGGLMIIVIVLAGFKTIGRNNAWKNENTLFLTDVKTVPNSALVNNNAAAACMNNAKKNTKNIPVRNEWFERAIKYFDRAIAINPQHTLSRLNRGLCYFNMGMPERALPDWDTVRKYNPGQENLEKYLATASRYFFGQGMQYRSAFKMDSAVYAFQKSCNAAPKAPEPLIELAKTYHATGRVAEATTTLEKALAIAPQNREVRALYDQIKTAGGTK